MMPRSERPAGWVSDIVPNPEGKSKQLVVHYRILPARAKQCAFVDRKDAERFRSALLMRLEAMPCGDSARTFDAAADAFLALCEKGAGDPVINERVLRLYIRPLLVGRRLDQIDEEVAQMVRRSVLAHKRVHHYQHNILASFDASIDAAVANEWLVARPIPKSAKPLPREAKSVAAWKRRNSKRMLSRQTVKLLLDRTEGLLKVIVNLALRAGLRVGEILALVWTNVKFDIGRIEITNSADSDTGPLKPTKTPAGERSVEMGPKLAKLLREWHDLCVSEGADGIGGRIVFRKKSRGAFSRHSVNRQLQAFLAKNGIGREFFHINVQGVSERRFEDTYSIHDLRHACVALWIWRDYDPTRIQTMIGHEHLRTTYDIYGYLIRRHEEGAKDWYDTIELASGAQDRDEHGTNVVTNGSRTTRHYGPSVKLSSRRGRRWWGAPAVKGEKVGRKPTQRLEPVQ